MKTNKFFGVAVGAIVGLVGFVEYLSVKTYIERSNYIPKTEQVQQGYVIPSKLEIELQDLDRDGENEVLMKYDGKSYLLKLDEKGRPQIQDYEIKPIGIVLKSE